MDTPRRTVGQVASALALLAALSLVGCETTTETAPAGLHLAVVRATHPVRAWRVLAEGRELGTVVLYESEDRPESPAGRFYSVRNPWQQELGTIDAQGRAWRFVPHEREARWVATGTLAEGAAAILEAGAARAEDATTEVTPSEIASGAEPVELVEVDVGSLLPEDATAPTPPPQGDAPGEPDGGPGGAPRDRS